MKTIEIPVLIAGGGPVGLCASILLSHHGVCWQSYEATLDKA